MHMDISAPADLNSLLHNKVTKKKITQLNCDTEPDLYNN